MVPDPKKLRDRSENRIALKVHVQIQMQIRILHHSPNRSFTRTHSILRCCSICKRNVWNTKQHRIICNQIVNELCIRCLLVAKSIIKNEHRNSIYQMKKNKKNTHTHTSQNILGSACKSCFGLSVFVFAEDCVISYTHIYGFSLLAFAFLPFA